MSNTTFYAAELMIYFEKHRFLEILRVLILKMGLDRPLCVKHYLRRNLRKIANSVLTKNTIIHIPDEFDVHKFVKNCLKMYHIPIITYNLRGTPLTEKRLEEILRKFEKFCRRSGIHNKNKIYLNFPKNFSQALTMRNCDSPPVHMIHVTTDKPASPNFQELLDFYHCDTHKVCVKCSAKDEKTVVPEVMFKLKHTCKPQPYDISANFVFRVVLLGRWGSGRETQAKLLAARFNLVYSERQLNHYFAATENRFSTVNIDKLISQALQKKDNISRMMCISFRKGKEFSSSSILALLWKRLLEKDALAKGWALVGFPKCVNEMQTIVENFQTPPNRIAVLHCDKNLALRRLVKKWEKAMFPSRSKVNTTQYAEKQFRLYDEQKDAMYAYLKKCGTKTIHIDSCKTICQVRNKLFALLER